MPQAVEGPSGRDSDGPIARPTRWPIVTLFVLTGAIYLWLCSDRSWSPFQPQNFGDIFDHLAIGIIHGRLDLPPAVIGTEAFIVDGRHYGYWGPFPALLRIPLALTGSSFWVGHTARLMCWLAGILSVYAATAILGELQLLFGWKPKSPGFVVCGVAALALGSHLPYLVACPFVYHESILWGTATALLAMQLGLLFLRQGQFGPLLGAVMMAGGSALTRPTSGYGALIGTSCLVIHYWCNTRRIRPGTERNRIRWRAVLLAGLTVVFFFLPLYYNYVRFGSFVRLPYEKHLNVEPWRVEITRHGNFQPVNFWPNARAYFDPAQIDVRPGFPYFHLAAYQARPPARIEHAEAYAGIPSFMTGLCLLALIGLQAVEREKRVMLLILGGLATLCMLLSFTAIAHRYEHDLFPLMVLLSASGMLWLDQREGVIPRLAKILMEILLAAGIWQSAAFTYFEQEWARQWFVRNPYQVSSAPYPSDRPQPAKAQPLHSQSSLGG